MRIYFCKQYFYEKRQNLEFTFWHSHRMKSFHRILEKIILQANHLMHISNSPNLLNRWRLNLDNYETTFRELWKHSNSHVLVAVGKVGTQRQCRVGIEHCMAATGSSSWYLHNLVLDLCVHCSVGIPYFGYHKKYGTSRWTLLYNVWLSSRLLLSGQKHQILVQRKIPVLENKRQVSECHDHHVADIGTKDITPYFKRQVRN